MYDWCLFCKASTESQIRTFYGRSETGRARWIRAKGSTNRGGYKRRGVRVERIAFIIHGIEEICTNKISHV